VLGLGETRKMTGFICDDGIIITIGCQNEWRGLSPYDMRIEVAKKYPPDHSYFAAIDLIERELTRREVKP
jgi:hypothetical protein